MSNGENVPMCHLKRRDCFKVFHDRKRRPDAADVTVRRFNGDPYIDPVAALMIIVLDDPMEPGGLSCGVPGVIGDEKCVTQGSGGLNDTPRRDRSASSPRQTFFRH